MNRLPGPNTTVISLLGRKPDRTSEFTFYTFRSELDLVGETRRGKSFREWLDHHHGDRGINVVEHPTIDYQGVPQPTRTAIAEDVNRLLTDGRTVVLVDSGGQQRRHRLQTPRSHRRPEKLRRMESCGVTENYA